MITSRDTELELFNRLKRSSFDTVYKSYISVLNNSRGFRISLDEIYANNIMSVDGKCAVLYPGEINAILKHNWQLDEFVRELRFRNEHRE